MGGSNSDSQDGQVSQTWCQLHHQPIEGSHCIGPGRVWVPGWVLTRFWDLKFGHTKDVAAKTLTVLFLRCFFVEKRSFCWWFLPWNWRVFQKIAKQFVMRRKNSANLAMPTWQNMSLSQFFRCQASTRHFVSGNSQFQKILMDEMGWFRNCNFPFLKWYLGSTPHPCVEQLLSCVDFDFSWLLPRCPPETPRCLKSKTWINQHHLTPDAIGSQSFHLFFRWERTFPSNFAWLPRLTLARDHWKMQGPFTKVPLRCLGGSVLGKDSAVCWNILILLKSSWAKVNEKSRVRWNASKKIRYVFKMWS